LVKISKDKLNINDGRLFFRFFDRKKRGPFVYRERLDVQKSIDKERKKKDREEEERIQ
jgi:hypothetical protein